MWPYYRLSTGQQDRFGFSIESQRPVVRGHVANNSGVVIADERIGAGSHSDPCRQKGSN
jgi:hypothetical protein